MTTFVLVPGAGGAAWYWHRLAPELERRGHLAIPVDIREDDPSLGLPDYADIVAGAVDGHTDVVLVAQSLGGFTAPVVAARTRLRMLVFLNAMIPSPGERPGEWFAATGHAEARTAAAQHAGRDPQFDEERDFLHDVPPEIAATGAGYQRAPADTPFGQRADFERWPNIPIKIIVGRDDRFFPLEFQRRIARERLGVDVDEIGGGHLAALSNPVELADRLVAYL